MKEAGTRVVIKKKIVKEDGRKWSDSRYILKVELKGLTD